jgi:hypothetical protein
MASIFGGVFETLIAAFVRLVFELGAPQAFHRGTVGRDHLGREEPLHGISGGKTYEGCKSRFYGVLAVDVGHSRRHPQRVGDLIDQRDLQVVVVGSGSLA